MNLEVASKFLSFSPPTPSFCTPSWAPFCPQERQCRDEPELDGRLEQEPSSGFRFLSEFCAIGRSKRESVAYR